MKKIILKTLVGSRAHGLHHEDSDYDFRGVFINSTSELLSLGNKNHTVSWVEGREDETSYELSHFLHLATKSNPSILEVLASPIQEITSEGEELRALFPYLWNSKDVYNAFIGYGHNQRKKFIENKDNRTFKYSVAYIRVLLLAEELLTKGTMTVHIQGSDIKNMLLEIKAGFMNKGFVIDKAEELEARVKIAYEANPNKETDLDRVNDYLLKVRKNNW